MASAPQSWRVEEGAACVFVARQTGNDGAAGRLAPDDARERLASYLALLPNVVAVGAKRIASDGKLRSMGEFIVNPKGFHSLGQGLPAHAFRFPEEVDAVAAGCMAIERGAYDRAGGLDTSMGDLACVDLCLRLRAVGGRCIVVPDATVVDDSPVPNPDAAVSASFIERWGFDWRCADLDAARERHGGAATRGLLWNARFWGRALPFEKYDQRGALHWDNYEKVEVFRQRADHLAGVVRKLTPAGGLAVDVGCGDGLYTHLVAAAGVETVGFDPEPRAIEQARAAAGRAYAGARPRFECGSGSALPLADRSARTVFLFDVIEHLPNPVAVLRETARVVAPGGHLVVSTPAWQYGASSDPVYHVVEYTPEELVAQVTAATGFQAITVGRITGIYRDIVLVARRLA